jgi:Na+/H+-dicarboxylate symporter
MSFYAVQRQPKQAVMHCLHMAVHGVNKMEKSKKAQGLPMSTIVIIILVALVLLVVGFIFLTYFTGGATGIEFGTNATKLGVGNLTEVASKP